METNTALMATAHQARHFDTLANNEVLCTLCPHDCHIADGGRGACGVRYNDSGRLWTLVYDKVIAREIDPVEKKPLFHFLPGSRVYSIATVGCNLRCGFCQNWQISQWPKAELPRTIEKTATATETDEAATGVCPKLDALEDQVFGEEVTPQSVVEAALRSGCQTIGYTYTEPTIFYELAYDTAVLAHENGLKNLFVSNGFTGEAAIREISTVLDAVNIDLKFFDEKSYRRVSRARLQPILNAIRLYHELGVWVEATTLVVPGLNDSDAELSNIAEFLCSVSPDLPWHVSQFYPAYKMSDTPVTPTETLRRAAEIGRQAGLRYVYEGNVPGEPGESTHCHQCGALLLERYGFVLRRNRIRDGACPDCGTEVAGVEMSGS